MLSGSISLKGKPYMDDRGEDIRGHVSSGNSWVDGKGTNKDNQGRDEPGSLDEIKNHKFFKEQPGCVHMEPWRYA